MSRFKLREVTYIAWGHSRGDCKAFNSVVQCWKSILFVRTPCKYSSTISKCIWHIWVDTLFSTWQFVNLMCSSGICRGVGSDPLKNGGSPEVSSQQPVGWMWTAPVLFWRGKKGEASTVLTELSVKVLRLLCALKFLLSPHNSVSLGSACFTH